MRFERLACAVPTAVAMAVAATVARADRPAALFPLADVPPARLPTPAELDRRWTAFHHADQATAGFNAVSLPIHYVDPEHLGDPAEADAFAFLLSGDLDWSPACYCQRHAYFVFKTDADAVASTVADGDDYHPAAVASLIDRWSATAAIGGTITRSTGGYAGVLTVCDPTGRVVHRRTFPTPQPFFHLLGDFSADALALLGPPPSANLVRFLHIRRCKDESIRRLGAAAHLPRGAADVEAFATILDHDAGFAEARYWVGNQAGWAGLSPEEQARQFALAMDSRVAPECWRALEHPLMPLEFDPRVPVWVAELSALAGPDAPALLMHDLNAIREFHVGIRVDYPAALAVAARYPNHYWLLNDLSWAIDENHTPGGPDLAASMALAAIRCRELTGTGSKSGAAEVFNAAATAAGRPGDGCAVLAAALVGDEDDFNRETAPQLLSALAATGRYKKAVDVYLAMKSRNLPAAAEQQVEAATAAAIVGRADVVDAILAEHRPALTYSQCLALVHGLSDRLAGRPVDLDPLWRTFGTLQRGSWQRAEYMLFLWQADLAGPDDRFHDEAERVAFDVPAFRPGRCVADLYDRRHPRPRAAEMYRAWRWLYPDDPMVRSALRAWTDRSPADAATADDVARTTAALAPFPARPFTGTPDRSGADANVKAALSTVSTWSVAASLGALCDRRQFDAAAELALRYETFCGRGDVPQPEDWAQHLTREVERCRSDAAAPAPPLPPPTTTAP